MEKLYSQVPEQSKSQATGTGDSMLDLNAASEV